MSDLTEFLLARIAEDEGLWQLAVDVELAFVAGKPAAISQHPMAAMPPGPLGRRMLTECQAKRRIVEDFEILHRDYRETHDPTTEARRFQARVAMSRVAAVYVDHPDYREEWKP